MKKKMISHSFPWQQAVELTVDVINRQSQKRSGVIATSSGNHAIAIAYHGKSLGIPVTVLLPESRCPVKIRLCEKYDADITECGLDESEVNICIILSITVFLEAESAAM